MGVLSGETSKRPGFCGTGISRLIGTKLKIKVEGECKHANNHPHCFSGVQSPAVSRGQSQSFYESADLVARN